MPVRNKQKLFGVNMPHFSGKSSLCKYMENYKVRHGRDLMFLDCDKLTQIELADMNSAATAKIVQEDMTFKKLYLFPLLQERIHGLMKNYKHSDVAIVTSNPDLIQFLGIGADKSYCLIPDNPMWNKIKVAPGGPKNDYSRDNLLTTHGQNVTFYSNYDELLEKIVDIFNLTKKI
jgi:hypothetical protein